MKTFQRILLALGFFSTLALAQTFPSNTFKFGNGSAANKTITFNRGSNNPVFRWNEGSTLFQFSSDGSTYRNFSLGGNLTTAANFTTSGANALTLTTTGSTNVTLPTTGTLATLAGSEVLTGKTLSGNTATNLISGSGTFTLNTTGTITVPNGTLTLATLTGSETLSSKTLTAPIMSTFVSNGVTFTLPTADGSAGQFIKTNASGVLSFGSAGGGGGSIDWRADGADAPGEATEFANKVFIFEDGLSQNLYGVIAVPQTYTAANPVKVRVKGYHQAASATQLLLCQSTLIPVGTAFDSTTNQRTSTNTAQTGASKVIVEHVCDVTDSTGHVNGVAVAAGDMIRVRMYRSTDSSTSDVSMIPSSTEVTFQ